jgi:hypothetical protein
MENLNHEVALLEMRTEQMRTRLQSVPASSGSAQGAVRAQCDENKDQDVEALRA